MPSGTGTAGIRALPARPAATAWSLSSGAVIAVATALGLGLRIFQLSRPGYLTGFTQYDDGVYIGNALRLVDGVIPYRDFAMVQPPGSMLLMVPAALLGKAFGSAWALSAARVLTVGADTANVALAGLLVRHRGALAAGIASGGYAVYPAALYASQSLYLEPWLNLFCLLGAVFLFDGDQIAGPGTGGRAGSRRPAWAGACFGFATAIKIWAVVPAAVAGALCLRARRGRLPFACGFAVGLAVPCLPFLALAPSGFGRTVFVSELVQATHGRVGATPRWANITGLTGLSGLGVNPHIWAGSTVAAALFVFVVTAWLLARRSGAVATALDWFALLSTLAVIAILFFPSEWYEHYAAFAGPFLAVLVALSAARLFASGRALPSRPGTPAGPCRPGTPAGPCRPGTPAGRSRQAKPARRILAAAAVVAALAIAAIGAADGYAVTKLDPAENLAGATALIPPGACVLTDTVSATIVIDRFSARSPGCPAIVDTVGTLISTTDGQDFAAGPAVLRADTRVWQLGLEQAAYVWLIGVNGYTGARIVWTPALHAYLLGHFRLVGLPGFFPGTGDVPGGGLYVRTSGR